MVFLDNFDARTVDPEDDFAPIPAGTYLAIISASEMKQTKAGTGSYLQLTFQIIEGEYKGRNLWTRLNLDNPNQTAVRIARRQLSEICHAVGVLTPADSCELHDLPCSIVVAQVPDQDGELRNEIKRVRPKAPAPSSGPATSQAAPWKK